MKYLIGLLMTFSLSLNAQKSFEGKISYKVDMEFKEDNQDWKDFLAQRWGDTLEIYHGRKGFQKRVYKNSKPDGFDFHIYDVKKNEYYAKWHHVDTIYFYDCAEMVTEFISLEKKPGKEILGTEKK